MNLTDNKNKSQAKEVHQDLHMWDECVTPSQLEELYFFNVGTYVKTLLLYHDPLTKYIQV